MFAEIVESGHELPTGSLHADSRLLGQRKDLRLGDLHHRTLRIDVEPADRFDLVTEKLNAQGARLSRGIDIQNASADRVLAGHFDRLAPLITDRFEMRFDGLKRKFLA